MLYAVLPTTFSELGFLPFQVGLILSANRWIRLLTNHFAEWLCRRFRLDFLISLAFVLGAALTFVYSSVAAFPILLTARVLWGLCFSFIRQIGVMTVVDCADRKGLGRLMGVYNGVARTGSVTAYVAGGIGHDLFGFSTTLFVFGLVSLAAVPLGAISRRALTQKDEERELGTGESISPGLLGCGFVVGCAGTGLMISTLGVILKETVGSSVSVFGVVIGVATLNGFMLAARWVPELTAAPLLGHLGDRVGRKKSAAIYFLMGSMALVVGSTSWARGGGMILAVLVFFFCAVGATVTLMTEAGSRGSRTVARFVTASDLGSAVGPVLGWSTQQLDLSTALILQIGSGLYAVGAILAIRVLTDREGSIDADSPPAINP